VLIWFLLCTKKPVPPPLILFIISALWKFNATSESKILGKVREMQQYTCSIIKVIHISHLTIYFHPLLFCFLKEVRSVSLLTCNIKWKKLLEFVRHFRSHIGGCLKNETLSQLQYAFKPNLLSNGYSEPSNQGISWGMKLTTFLYLVLRLRIYGTVPQFSHKSL
jgi:hypothetical protein